MNLYSGAGCCSIRTKDLSVLLTQRVHFGSFKAKIPTSSPGMWSRSRSLSIWRRLRLRALSVSSGLLCNFVAVYVCLCSSFFTTKTLYTIVHLLWEEFNISLKSCLSAQSLCLTMSRRRTRTSLLTNNIEYINCVHQQTPADCELQLWPFDLHI